MMELFVGDPNNTWERNLAVMEKRFGNFRQQRLRGGYFVLK